MSVNEVESFLGLMKTHGYADENAEEYKVNSASVEYPNEFFIYVEKI